MPARSLWGSASRPSTARSRCPSSRRTRTPRRSCPSMPPSPTPKRASAPFSRSASRSGRAGSEGEVRADFRLRQPIDRTMTSTTTRSQEKQEQKSKGLPPYNVILLDDEDHSFEYVIHMLKTLFGHPPEKGYRMAVEVHTTGRVIVARSEEHRVGKE